MDKAWAKSGLTFEDEQWAWRRSEAAIERTWKGNLKLVDGETKKKLIELENVVKNMMLTVAYMEGYRDGKTN